jgi:hypothetical protein
LNGYDAPDIDGIMPAASRDQEEICWDEWIKGGIARTWGAVYEKDLARIDHTLMHQTPAHRCAKKIFTMGFLIFCYNAGQFAMR